MEAFFDWAERLVRAIPYLLLNPFYWVTIVLVALVYRRQSALESKLFHVRLHRAGRETARAVGWGLAAGVGASCVMIPLGVTLTPESAAVLLVIAAVLTFFRIRYLCFAYATGLFGLMQWGLRYVPEPFAEREFVAPILRAIADTSVPSLLVLVAILHLAEAALVRREGARAATPLFVESKRGKIVGAYQFYALWPVPLFLLVPASAFGVSGAPLPWQPPFADGETAAWTLAALPAALGFADRTVTRLPKSKARRSARRLAGYGVFMLAAAFAAARWEALLPVASILSFALHEAIIVAGHREEKKGAPLFLHDGKGLKILAVIPGSPAAKLGLMAGETIRKVNQEPVLTKEDLHRAMRLNPAYCRLEVLNLAGESKFVSTALYADEHHQLGIVLAPDERATHYVSDHPRHGHAIAFFRRKTFGLRQKGENAPG